MPINLRTQISWKIARILEMSMGQNAFNDEGGQHRAKKDASAKSGGNTTEEVTSSNGDPATKSNALWFFGLLDAGLVVLFWGWSEFFGSHNSPMLSNLSFFVFVSSALGGIAYFTYKHWPQFKIIAACWIILCVFSGGIIYEYSVEIPAPVEKGKPQNRLSLAHNPPLSRGPSKIFFEINDARPAEQESVAQSFIGAKVKWLLKLDSIYHDVGKTFAEFSDDGLKGDGLVTTPIQVLISKNQENEMRLSPKYSLFCVSGNIAGVFPDIWITNSTIEPYTTNVDIPK